MNKNVLIDVVPYPAMTPGASAELVRLLIGPTPGVERDIGVDQTNVSVIVDESVVVKWLTPPVVEPHPGVQLLEHLAEVGFAETPTLLGVARVNGRVEAVLSEYIPNSQDGWEWYVDDVLAWLEGVAPLESLVETAARLGALAARLHDALATPSSVISMPVVTVPTMPIHQAAQELLAEAIKVTAPSWPLREPMVERIRGEIEVLAEVSETVGQPIHGDLHVGQILRAAEQLWVIDFDGDPLADAPTRRQPQPAARDVAGLLQSIDHVARVAHRRRPDVDIDTIERLITPAVTAALDAYRQALGGARLLDGRLVRPLQVVQELHELVYAARHLDRWRYVPQAALPALLNRSSEE